MNIDLVFKIAAIGIIIAILDQVLRQSKHEEMATMTSLAGLIIVLVLIVNQISQLFSTIKTIFQL